MIFTSFRARRSALLATSASMILAGFMSTSAQDAAAEDEDKVEEVVVTGSRIKRQVDKAVRIDAITSEEIELRGFNNVIEGIDQLVFSGASVTNEGGNGQFGDNSAFPNLLGLGTNRTLTLVNGRRFVSSNQATVFVPGNANGAQVDLSVYNPQLIERQEILTLGGGAIYGADAVAGVVNLILKDDYEGLNIVGQAGITEQGDGEEFRVSTLWGKNFLDGRANVTIGVEYQHQALVTSRLGINDRVVDAQAEEFLNPFRGSTSDGIASTIILGGVTNPSLAAGGVLVNTQFIGGGGLPLIPDSVRNGVNFFAVNPLTVLGAFGVGNGLVINNNDPSTNTQFPNTLVPLRFDGNGNLVSFNLGDFINNPAERIRVVGGDGLPNGSFTNVRSAQERVSVNLLARYDVADNITLKQDVVFAYIDNRSLEGPQSNSAFGSASAGSRAIPVFIDENPFFNNGNRAIIEGLVEQGLEISEIGGARSLFLSRELSDVTGPAFSGNEQYTFRTSTSLEGNFNWLDRDFNWDVAFIYGRSESDNFDTNILDIEFALATDVVLDEDGNTVCRQQTLDAPEAINIRNPSLGFINTGVSLTPTAAQVAACQPLNLFGNGNASQAAADYITTSTDSNNLSQQYLAAGNLGGNLFNLPAGEALFNLSFEYRSESNEFDPGPVFGLGLARNTQGRGSEGTLEFLEGGAEVVIPITGGNFQLPGFDFLELTGAFRVVSRSVSSNSNPLADEAERATDEVWTFGGTWTPYEPAGVSFRGNVSRAVRSPSVVELVGAGVTGFAGGGDSDFACDADNIDGGPNPAVRRANCEAAFAALGISDQLEGFQIPDSGSRPAAGGSNPNLSNEKADSWTVGIVWQPDFIPGLTLEADWLSIDLEDQIDLSFQVNTCYDDATFPDTAVGGFPACEAALLGVQAGGQFAPNADPSLGIVIPEINPLTGRPVPALANPGSPSDNQILGAPAFIFFPTLNVDIQELRALNTRATYAFDIQDVLGETSTDFGSMAVTGSLYYVHRNTICASGDCVNSGDDIQGEVGSPRWNGRVDLQHAIGRFSHLVQWFHTSSTVRDLNQRDSADDQAFDFVFPSTNRINYNAQYQFTDNITARVVVDNVFNERRFELTDTLGFDPLGRRFTLSVEVDF